MGTKYELSVVNGTKHFRDFCVYQTDPDIGVPWVQSLAWLVDGGHSTTVIDFSWTIDYSFIWDEVEQLKPGVVFNSSQCWPADPAGLTAPNQVVFDMKGGAYTFEAGAATGTTQVGSLYIRETGNIPLDDASVGIGMSGSGTFAVEAEPNENLIFTPHPTYWLTAGTYQQGEVLDITEITNPVQVGFPPGVFKVTATLTPANLWEITPNT